MTLNLQIEDFARLYAVIWLVEIGLTSRWLRIFFGSEVNGGYRDDFKVRMLNGGWFQQVVIAIWGTIHIFILVSEFWQGFLAAALFLNHHHFVRERWRSLLRGMGAPGFMLYWMSAAVLLLSVGEDVGGVVQSAIEALVVVDFASIMITAGFYKLKSGYRRGFGIEFGLVNPQWCYFHNFFRKLRSSSIVFRSLNELSWSLEVAGGILLFFPTTRLFGVAVISLGFIFLLPLIRLGVLCLTVISCCLVVGSTNESSSALFSSPFESQLTKFERFVALFVCIYFIGMLTTRFIQMRNVFSHKSLPRIIQRFSEIFGNLFGIILWRVFTPDVTGFAVEIEIRDSSCANVASSKNTELPSMWGRGRFAHVAEAIAVTSLFTLRRYLPNAHNLFENRLIRHAKSLADPEVSAVTYRYLEVVKVNTRFCLLETARFDVMVISRLILQVVMPTSNLERAIGPSPVRPGVRLGSYEQRQTSREQM